MKKLFLLFFVLCASLSFIFSTDSFTMTTTLNYSKPGGVKSDSRPTMKVGETWNLEISIDATGRVKIGRLLTGTRNFIKQQQEAIVMEINTNISPDELKITTEKNLIPYKMEGQKPYFDEDDNSWWYVYCLSPKQKNQQISFQFIPESNDIEYKLSIQYYYINDADDSFFVKNTDYLSLINNTGSKNEEGEQETNIHNFMPLTYSDVLYTFDVK